MGWDCCKLLSSQEGQEDFLANLVVHLKSSLLKTRTKVFPRWTESCTYTEGKGRRTHHWYKQKARESLQV